jgi:DNA-directed RNA polymerase subunit F
MKHPKGINPFGLLTFYPKTSEEIRSVLPKSRQKCAETTTSQEAVGSVINVTMPMGSIN